MNVGCYIKWSILYLRLVALAGTNFSVFEYSCI